ncbi:hypothetical protein [Mycobacterium talmoniae]|uniref:Uncharacterized protein n=1 Tax=Mycobacterium talmoniae TaxID=1858794 RepID=A0A1S1NAH1_9MYCO|nr:MULTISPECIES: hypothetical protein [Mycobacterium]OHU97043.1 hypothetical protein BKN37_22360 [Mycobacterium talmoniae]PQM49499.1 hypothetical protein C1Y40_00276 [Mycobacterium talmoniae]TDH48053.1 hypothetical protein E2F47_25360 [Mycobacterium eburneum]
MAGERKQRSLASWVFMLAVLFCVAGFGLFSGVRLLANPETCDGHAMAANDTCRHGARGSERLQSAVTTTVMLPPRPKLPPGMGDDVPDVWSGPPSVTATVPVGDGRSLQDQISSNQIKGTFETMLGAGTLILAIVLSAVTVRGYRRRGTAFRPRN